MPCEPFFTIYARIQQTGALEGIHRHAFKIDVEGHEIELLEGMKEYFSHFKGEIFIVVRVRGPLRKKSMKSIHHVGLHPRAG